MSITVGWDNHDKTIVLFTVDGEYTSDDMIKADQEIETLTQQVSHKIGVIKDLSRGQMRVENLVTITWGGRSVIRGDFGTSIKNVPDTMPSNPIAITVFVIPNNYFDSLASTFQKMLAAFPGHSNTMLVSSVDDARSRITQYLSENKY